ncbi:monoheme cytochrome C [Maribacter sp. 2307ULW6-5]|uniref:monoheme cytochrome C n=1 Tax=Maribacter sp. 2307ULW6-5 TaxID=3386275 RepID=UPI0039BC9F12
MERQKEEQFKKSMREVRRLIIILWSLAGLVVLLGIYLMADPTLSLLNGAPETAVAPLPEDDYDKIENGIHLRTGLVDAPGLMETVNNCTNCHSAKLVTQNRMDKERWRATIRWMQETQNLWDLGKNEDIIIDYLVKNYPPQEVGRRANLKPVDWYVLDAH